MEKKVNYIFSKYFLFSYTLFHFFCFKFLFLYFFSFLRKLRLNEIGKEIKNTRKFLIFECKKIIKYIFNIKRLKTCGLAFFMCILTQ